jgi:hypothetical protein
MPKLINYPVRAVGICWFREEDYPALLLIFEDANKMPLAWKEWCENAERLEKRAKAEGHIVERVYSLSRSPKNIRIKADEAMTQSARMTGSGRFPFSERFPTYQRTCCGIRTIFFEGRRVERQRLRFGHLPLAPEDRLPVLRIVGRPTSNVRAGVRQIRRKRRRRQPHRRFASESVAAFPRNPAIGTPA